MYKNKRVFVSFITVFIVISFLFPTQAYYLNSAKPITKGSNGFSCIYLLTFKHESLMPYLNTAESKKGLYLMNLAFMERNTDVVELMLAQNHAIGLITQSNKEEFNLDTFKKELEQFRKITGSLPLWATSENEDFSEELLKASHAAAINMLAANTYFNSSYAASSLPKGSFLFIAANQHFDFHSKPHLSLIGSEQVRSIEENLFNLKTIEESMP